MLRIKLLRNLLLLSVAITVFLPGHEYLVLHPAYKKLLIEETENEAVRYASYMVRTLGLEDQSLTKDRLPEGLENSLRPASRDTLLLKLRIFSAQGEIIFSTQADEIGNLNESSYFLEIVAKGNVYSKVVQKDQKTADGVIAKIDVVETYVPFMADDSFGGAIEVYYDITERMRKIGSLSLHSIVSTTVLAFAFLLAMCVALYRTYFSIQKRAAAETALQAANEALEERVIERTQELSDANEQLTNQIAERAQAQMALAKVLEEIKVDREKLDGILTSVPDGVVLTDGSMNVVHMNSPAEKILGVTLTEISGQSVSRLGRELDFKKKIVQQLKVSHGSRSFDLEVPCKSSHNPNIYQVRVSHLLSPEKESSGTIMVLRDVTREREVERMKSAFLGMAAHELNTPLTTIIGYSELLTDVETAENFNDEQRKNFLLLIHSKALALGGLVDDLLDVSRVESGRPLSLDYQDVSLEALVRDVLASYAEERGPHHFVTALHDSVHVFADRLRLKQVVDHLISNAVKYAPAGGEIKVGLTVLDDKCELTVEDQGLGMDEEHLAHIFDRFYRADSSDTAVQGVGLGMSLVRNIVLAHHGDILVESQLGQGTRVRVLLPLTPPVGQDESHQPFSAT